VDLTGRIARANHGMSSIEHGVLEIPKQQMRESDEANPRFRESFMQRLRRYVLGTAYALVPERIALLPRLTLLTIAHLLAPEAERDRLPEQPVYYSRRGLVGISNDLSLKSLIANYARGFFPVCHIGPMKWWSPEERAVIDPADTHVGKNLRRLLKQKKFTVTFDRAFGQVVEACARPREGKVPLTWITPMVMSAYSDAHRAGYAHSVEVWDQDGNLVGGLYGLAIGKVFFGESQFSSAEHSSKVAMVALHRHLREWGYHVRDGKWMTPHLASFGFKTMKRQDFQALLAKHVQEPSRIGPWSVDPRLDLADWAAKSTEAEPKLRQMHA
jgi:leucyl/phenylalanyl-tRNA---protein transferase